MLLLVLITILYIYQWIKHIQFAFEMIYCIDTEHYLVKHFKLVKIHFFLIE